MDRDNKLFLVGDFYIILDKYTKSEITVDEVVDMITSAAGKWRQRELLINIMKQDEDDGLYDI